MTTTAIPIASWVIRDKTTGAVVMETFRRQLVDRLNTAKYEAVPIQDHLTALNREIRLRAAEAAQAEDTQAVQAVQAVEERVSACFHRG